jgi:hypothetical protein
MSNSDIVAWLGLGFGLLLLIIAPILTSILGWFAGVFVGFFVPGLAASTLDFFSQLGIEDLRLSQIGAAVGFIGGFFKTALYHSKYKA